MARKRSLFLRRVLAILNRWSRISSSNMRLSSMRRVAYALLMGLSVLLWIVAVPGLAAFSALEPPLPTVSTTASAAQEFDRQGRSHYTAGEFAAAVNAFQQAADAYQTAGNTLQQSLSLSNVSLAYQQLGAWVEAEQAVAESIQLLPVDTVAPPDQQQTIALAQALDIRGRLQLAIGQAEPALQSWEQATVLYQQSDRSDRALDSQINQAQALQALGFYRRAIALLYPASGLADQSPVLQNGTPKVLEDITPNELQIMLQSVAETPSAIAALHSLGESLRVVGNLTQAELVFNRSLAIAEGLDRADAIAASKLRLGNLARARLFASLNVDARFQNLTLERAVDLIWRLKMGKNCDVNKARVFYTDVDQVLQLYREAAIHSPSGNTQIQANLNQLRVLIDTAQWSEIRDLPAQIQSQLEQLPLSSSTLYAQINLAQSLVKLKQVDPMLLAEGAATPCNAPITLPFRVDQGAQAAAAQLLSQTIQQAKELHHLRAESYALGVLGELYEQAQQWESNPIERRQQAQYLTQRALVLSQQINAAEISYRWQWQLGRLLKAQGDRKEAIAAYQEALATLQSIRGDLIANNPEEQFAFRDSIEPIHRELVALLLATDSTTPNSDDLTSARNVIESLQLAELDNFFREACLNSREVDIDRVDQQAAVIYPIILSDRLEVIVSLPQPLPDVARAEISVSPTQQTQTQQTQTKSTHDRSWRQTLRHYTTYVSQEQIESVVNQLLDSLRSTNTGGQSILLKSQQIYDWLIQPVETDLATSGAKTLVFVLDGVLRNIPMAALYDGNQYLIQKYSIALTPSLQLLESQSLRPEHLSVLLAGLSEKRSDFEPLPGVTAEFQKIEGTVPDHRTLLNEQFTNVNLQAAINAVPFPVVHLATHGKFSSNVEDTFILTWDGKININQLNRLLQATDISRRRSIELLVLSACETAKGDPRATLGLAGVAVRAGARSTIASLWKLSDDSAPLLMQRFYEELGKGTVTKAEALRRSQLALLADPKFSKPFYWSSVVLIGNWL